MTVKPIPRQPGREYTPPAHFPTPLGQLVYQYLSATHVSINQFSEMVGIHRSTLVSIMQATHTPQPNHIHKIAKGLGIRPAVAFLLATPNMISDGESLSELSENEEDLRKHLGEFDQITDKQRAYLDHMLKGDVSNSDLGNNDYAVATTESMVMAREAINSIGSVLYSLLAQNTVTAVEQASLQAAASKIPEMLELLNA